MGLFVNRGGERLDISRRVSGLYLHNSWCAAQVVVESDTPHGVDEGIVEGSPLGSFVVKRSMLDVYKRQGLSIAQANLTLGDHSHTHKVLHSKSFIKFFR